jgi:hypothetical protein
MTTDTTAGIPALPTRVPATDADLDAVQVPLAVAAITVARSGLVPTGALIALSSPSTVASAVRVLDRSGYVASVVHADRGLVLVAGMPTGPSDGDDQGEEPEPTAAFAEPAPAGAPAPDSDDYEEPW